MVKVIKKDVDKVKIKHNWKILIIILVLLVILYFVILQIKIKLEEKDECKVDEDCVKQQVTCCSCENGGQEICMPEKNVSYWEQEFEKCGKDLVCSEVYNCESENCGCVDGGCLG